VLAVIVIALDWRTTREVVDQANWAWLSLALVVCAVSYYFFSEGFVIASRVFGINMPYLDLLEISFISNVLNNMMTSGGAAGYSLRVIIMKRRGPYSTADILTASLFHSYFNTLLMLSMLPVVLGYVLFTQSLTHRVFIGVIVSLILAGIALGIAIALFFSPWIRTFLLYLVRRVTATVIRRDFAPQLRRLDTTITYGISAFRKQPARLAWLLVTVVLNWGTMLVVLGICFVALGDLVAKGVLFAGFAIGMTAGVISMIPGGLGIQDGSMAGIYALLGVPIGEAVLVVVLFRVVYYFIPFGISLLFYWRLMHSISRQEA